MSEHQGFESEEDFNKRIKRNKVVSDESLKKITIDSLEIINSELKDPEALEDITQNVQQTLNVIEANKIINDNPNKDEL